MGRSATRTADPRFGLPLLLLALLTACPAALAAGAAPTAPTAPGGLAALRARAPQDEVVYFLLPDRFENGDPSNDRGGLSGGPLQTGFDPTAKGFYHGGDLKGVLARLDYIKSLGATALWLGPIYRNKPVQGPAGHESAGYHGYWITDFTRVDPHFGSNEDLTALIAAAHQHGMKVYLDIITNHTADVIAYRECPQGDCPYRSHADYPYTRRGGLQGEPINDGFLGDDAPYQTAENFARLTRPDYAYTPYVPPGDEHLKVPEWLNDPIYYHNRGNTTFRGESSTFGDFGGLDDLMTENPRVVQGFVDIYGAWIDDYGVDGFRVDTARHVNPEFWQQFIPAMLARARAQAIPNFHIFGEVNTGDTVDTAQLALHTRVDRFPAVLDFAFANAVRAVAGGHAGTDLLARVFADDALYEGGAEAALQLPTFISNHDNGRFAWVARREHPGIKDAELLQRVQLAHAMLLNLRGVPVIYYGDEQGFAGLGGDQAARQDMFATRVPSYLAEHLPGGARSDAAHFDTQYPLYKAIAAMARLRTNTPALRSGRQVVRGYGPRPGLFAVSRFDPAGREVLVAFNTSGAALSAQVTVEPTSLGFTALHGACEPAPGAPGSYHVSIPALDYIICAANPEP